MIEKLQIRIHGSDSSPVLIYLPGLHGDWTLIPSFRSALGATVRFVEITYPRTLVWSIHDYAEQIEIELLRHGVTSGWLLGESFGSQVAWAMLERSAALQNERRSGIQGKHFVPTGLMLAGGFVKHPWSWGPDALRRISELIPLSCKKAALKLYKLYARLRHRNAPETLAGVDEFLGRRTALDQSAMQHRLELLNQYDPRAVAQGTKLPVYYLAGLVDPLVPYPLVRNWLGKNCPGYRGGKTFWRADHNVLATAPIPSARTILKWIAGNSELAIAAKIQAL